MAFLLGRSKDTNGNFFELTYRKNYFEKCKKTKTISITDKKNNNDFFLIENQNESFFFKTDRKAYINGLKTPSQQLHEGDEIEINDDLFKVILKDNAIYENQTENLLFCQSDRFIISEKTMTLKDNLSVHYTPKSLSSETIFYQLYTSLNLKDFISKSIKIVSKYFKINRILFFIWNENTCSFEKQNIEYEKEEENNFLLSKTVLSYMLANKKSLLCQDLIKDDRFKKSASLFEQQVHSIMSSPLIIENNIQGFIYLDSTDPSNRFSQDSFNKFNMMINQISFLLHHFKKTDKLEQMHNDFDEVLNKNLKLIGQNSNFNKTLKLSHRVAKTEISVIIKGESGTGKELLAKYIHQSSLRKHKEMICVNCASINDNLFESEFFGHVKGSFTGALDNKKGFFELSNESTIFLDEVGELSLTNQAKLLRVLQEKEFYKVGGVKPIKVNIRVISATNADLKQMMINGKFRKDLYYRLNSIQINIPSLRDRISDIKILSEFFINSYAHEYKVPVKILNQEALQVLNNYSWPGNIRELKHKIEQAMILTDSLEICSTDFIDCIDEGTQHENTTESNHNETYKESIKEFEKKYFIDLLQKTNGNVSLSSQISRLERSYLYQKLKKYQLSPNSFR